jgi:hypothetical protein
MTNPDAFWDGGQVKYPSHLDPAKYHDPSEEVLPFSKRSMAAAMPPGVWGATGVIVPASDEQGNQLGYDPNSVAARVNVDPDIPGEGFVVDMTQINQRGMEDAVKSAKANQATSVEDRRFKASNAFRNFSTGQAAQAAPTIRQPLREAPINLPGAYIVPPADEQGGQLQMEPDQPQDARQPLSVPTFAPKSPLRETQYPSPDPPDNGQGANTGLSAPNYAILDVGGPPDYHNMVRAAAVAPTHPQEPGPQAVQPAIPERQSLSQPHLHTPPMTATAAVAPGAPGPPTAKVDFEVRGTPFKNEAFFHQVIRHGPNLIMVFDNRAVGYPRMFPQTVQEDLAVHITGSEVIYITAATGIQFPLDHYEVCVLLIKDEYPYGG